jgi:hypothetical protein
MSDNNPPPVAKNYVATAILDFDHPRVSALVAKVKVSSELRGPLPAAHTSISTSMEAVYSIDDTQVASKTFLLNKGSCAQRMVCLETLARGLGIATRVRALWLDKTFWYFRVPLLRHHLPERTLMPWPQFNIGDLWIDFDEIYAPISELAAHPAYDHPFTNAGESLFDAVQHTPVDLLSKLRGSQYAKFDIGRFVVEDGGFFDTRDDLYQAVDERNSLIANFVFNLLYGGRPIRRQRD